MSICRLSFLGLSIVLTSALVSHASSPTFWHVSTQAGFLAGEIENLSLDESGRLVLGPATDLVYEATVPFIWRVVPDTRGGLWLGTGNEGQVIHVDSSGRASTFFDAPELEAHALAPAPDGGLFVGTSPDGKIYRVSANGSSTTIFDPEERYIWSLTVGKDGALYAGTGDKGVIYRIPPGGEASKFYETKATHVTALEWDPAGNLLAATESPGRLFRIDKSGKGFVLLDVPFEEVHAIRAHRDGTIYVTALSGRDQDEAQQDRQAPEPSQQQAPTASVSTEITITAVGDVSVSPSSQQQQPRGNDTSRAAAGAVFRINPDGLPDLIWESTEDAPYDLAFDPKGALLVGTGNKGKIFRIDGDPSKTTLLSRATAQQVTAMSTIGSALFVATSNPAKLFKLSSTVADRGSYLSAAHDASTGSTWGVIRWQAAVPSGARLELATRSGNTRTPDETWSEWSSAYQNAAGDQISSPKARYLQWRAVLTGKGATPELTSVTAAYLPRNVRPQVASILVHPPGTVFQKPFPAGDPPLAGFEEVSSEDRNPGGGPPAPALGRRLYQKGLQTFAWKAEDSNGDRLIYTLWYRREGETAWKRLKDDVRETIFTWDTTSVPDGTYQVKITAVDSPSNPPSSALAGEKESDTFDIDNTPPQIEIREVTRANGRTRVTLAVRDQHSPLERVEYSLDASRWRLMFPRDGLADARIEEYVVDVDAQETGRVLIRAADGLNNVATAVADLREPTR